MHVEDEDGSRTVNWDLENFDEIKHPLVYEYDVGVLFDSDPDYLDFIPASAFQKDLKFRELSALDCSQSAPETSPKVKEECDIDNGPCEAALTIAANLPTPEPKTMSKWRTFISTAFYHPNILAHKDVVCLKGLFQLLGSDIYFANAYFLIDLGKGKKSPIPILNLRPPLHSSQRAQLLAFAHIKDFTVEAELKICIVKKYSIMDSMKEAVGELVQFIIEYPEALYLEMYGFVLDFFLRFGIQPDVIIDAVMKTQARRRKSQRPASILIMKQANSLGKGKKEFLQKVMLSSPDKKYDPVVPIIAEPTPVRHLRNRRTGDIPDARTPKCTDIKPEIQNSINTCDPMNVRATLYSTATETKKSAQDVLGKTKTIKRKLFQDVAIIKDGLVEERYKSVPGKLLKREKKSFYLRRDDSPLVKAFVCTICDNRSFTYKGNLTVHMKKYHPRSILKKPPSPKKDCVSQYSCPVCLINFSKMFLCKRHIQKSHPDQADWEPLENKPEPNQSTINAMGRTRRQCTLRPNVRQSKMSSQDLSFPSTRVSSCNYDDYQKLSISALEPQQFNFRISSGFNFTIDSLQSLPPIGHSSVQQHFRATVK